jgi:isopenicillin-N epimerase
MGAEPHPAWSLDPDVTFLNHGSFGACPVAVLEAQQRLRARLERQPVRFFGRELERLLDDARGALAAFVGAAAEDLAFVPNATTGVNSVLRSLRLRPGDEILVTNHTYNACRTAADYAAGRAGATVAVAHVPFPIHSSDAAVDAILTHVTSRTRLAVVDHVTSPTGLVLPIARLVAELAARGVDALVDGAHAPGMVAIDLERIGAAYYTANCHKWLCAPKGAGFLHVRRDRQVDIRPLAISHGANSPRTDRSRFLLEFDWTGTHDPTPYLCVPEAIRHVGSLLPGGWPAVMARNRALALEARAILGRTLGNAAPAPDDMIGSLVSMPLPDGPSAVSPLATDPLQEALLDRFAIEVPVFPWPAPPARFIRLSCQLYNARVDYERLATALTALLGERRA